MLMTALDKKGRGCSCRLSNNFLDSPGKSLLSLEADKGSAKRSAMALAGASADVAVLARSR